MNRVFKPVLVFGLVIAILASYVAYTKLHKESPEIIPWRTDFAAAEREAQGKDKLMLVYLTATWCGPCQGLVHTTWADPEVAAALKQYIPVKVDVDQNKNLAARYRCESVPMFIVTDSAGDPRRQGVGAMPPVEFLNWLTR